MPAAAKHPALTSGHGGHHPTVSAEGSGDVFINGSPAITVGHMFVVHIKPGPDPAPHPPEASEGSGTVFINGQPACRTGDGTDCGDVIADGSRNVFIGG